ncbi:MAG: S41 family peptidase [Candidatus Zhuqueibacterota bacterium]
MRFFKLTVLIVLTLASFVFAAIEGRFMSSPNIRGEKIVFTYEGDLWTVNATGGTAMRLTSHPGNEETGKISPDGKWIAFSGNYDNGSNVYLIPMEGGTPNRLTYHVSADVITWTPDSKQIIFRSGHENTFRPIVKLYSVTPNGGLPEELPVPSGVLCTFSPDGKKMVYNTRGREEYYWKRYKGGQYQDIWMYDFAAKAFTKLTDYVGKNSYPMWIGDGMYFVSDRGENGIANIYHYNFTTKKIDPITQYDNFDVQMASTDGTSIVYMHSGYLYRLNPAQGTPQQVHVSIPTDNWRLADRTVNPKDYVHSMSISDDGKTAVFEARGDVFLVPTGDEGDTKNLTNSAGSRERYPQVSPDGKSIAFFSDKSGEYELYMMNLKPGSAWIQLTNGMKNTVYHLEWSPDSKKILFGNKDFAIFYVDVTTKKLVKIDSSNQLKNDEFYWEISDYSWSPDSKWVTYSFVQFNRNSIVFLYNLELNSRHPITSDFYDNINPSFDANGEYLYFLSYCNFDVQMDVFEDNHVVPNPVKVMVVQLKNGQKPLFQKLDDVAQKSSQPFRIDLEGIQDRVFSLPVNAGNYFYLKAGKGMVTWASVERFGDNEYEQIFKPTGSDQWDLHIFDMGKEKDTVLKEQISDWRLSSNRDFIIIKKRNDYSSDRLDKLCSSQSIGEKINLSEMTYRVKPVEEWTQIFNDAWRWYRDFFYDPNMHGHDWKKMGDTYKTYIPQLRSRQDLNWLLSQMVGELCVSHTYVGGGDTGPSQSQDNPVFTGLLGAELKKSDKGYYQFETIFGATKYNRDLTSPLARPDFNIKEGDYLLAIDGVEVKYPDDPYAHLQVTRGQKVKLTVNSAPTMENSQVYEIEPIRSERGLRYERWLADNIDKTLALSRGEIGYMHITAMGSGNVAQFDKFWRAFRYKKGLIIDVRGNGGGWTEYFLIDKLERKMVAYNCLKNMEPFRYPGSVCNGHLAVVTNEHNGSDGEAFIEHFKARKLGTVIGTPSWGGLVGIVNGQTTIDNGIVHQSNNSFYGRDGKWLVENHGADPDMLVENDPASVMQGHDKQLETAIQVLLDKIKAEPYQFPAKPAYPVR